jgi:hypothetical protein
MQDAELKAYQEYQEYLDYQEYLEEEPVQVEDSEKREQNG